MLDIQSHNIRISNLNETATHLIDNIYKCNSNNNPLQNINNITSYDKAYKNYIYSNAYSSSPKQKDLYNLLLMEKSKKEKKTKKENDNKGETDKINIMKMNHLLKSNSFLNGSNKSLNVSSSCLYTKKIKNGNENNSISVNKNKNFMLYSTSKKKKDFQFRRHSNENINKKSRNNMIGKNNKKKKSKNKKNNKEKENNDCKLEDNYENKKYADDLEIRTIYNNVNNNKINEYESKTKNINSNNNNIKINGYKDSKNKNDLTNINEYKISDLYLSQFSKKDNIKVKNKNKSIAKKSTNERLDIIEEKNLRRSINVNIQNNPLAKKPKKDENYYAELERENRFNCLKQIENLFTINKFLYNNNSHTCNNNDIHLSTFNNVKDDAISYNTNYSKYKLNEFYDSSIQFHNDRKRKNQSHKITLKNIKNQKHKVIHSNIININNDKEQFIDDGSVNINKDVVNNYNNSSAQFTNYDTGNNKKIINYMDDDGSNLNNNIKFNKDFLYYTSFNVNKDSLFANHNNIIIDSIEEKHKKNKEKNNSGNPLQKKNNNNNYPNNNNLIIPNHIIIKDKDKKQKNKNQNNTEQRKKSTIKKFKPKNGISQTPNNMNLNTNISNNNNNSNNINNNNDLNLKNDIILENKKNEDLLNQIISSMATSNIIQNSNPQNQTSYPKKDPNPLQQNQPKTTKTPKNKKYSSIYPNPKKDNNDLLPIIPVTHILNQTNNSGNYISIIAKELNDVKLQKISQIKKEFLENNSNSNQKHNYNSFIYSIAPGNASYLVKNCMCHRINWKESSNLLSNIYNFRWQELGYNFDYSSLSTIKMCKKIVNHYEFNNVISNKANLFINLFKYCEDNNLSVFKYVPFTIVFKVSKNDKKNKSKLNKLKLFINSAYKYTKKYEDIGKYDFNKVEQREIDAGIFLEEDMKNKIEVNTNSNSNTIPVVKEGQSEQKKDEENKVEENVDQENKDKDKDKEIDDIKKTENKQKNEIKYIEYFNNLFVNHKGRTKYILGNVYKKMKMNKTKKNTNTKGSDKIINIKITNSIEDSKDKENLHNSYIETYENLNEILKNSENLFIVGNRTLIEIPETHNKGKNMWVIKATNLNRGQCIRIVDNFEGMEKIIKQISEGSILKEYQEGENEEKEEKEIDDELPIKEIKVAKESTVKQTLQDRQENQEKQSKSQDKLEKSIPAKPKKSITVNATKARKDSFNSPTNVIPDIKDKILDKNVVKKQKQIPASSANQTTKEQKDINQKYTKAFTTTSVNNPTPSNINNSSSNANLNEKDNYQASRLIIQKYIESPLLYKGRKFDMRIWVLLTHKMQVFVFKEGHLKECSNTFDINCQNLSTHITNYSFQKHCNNFGKFEKGNEIPFFDFQKFLDNDEKYKNRKYSIKNDLMKQVKEIIEVTMKAARNSINCNKRKYTFEIFGYDFMLDSNFNLFLIEINMNPGYELSSPWISLIVPRMLDDALRLTIDDIFGGKYNHELNYKENNEEEEKKNNGDDGINSNELNGNDNKCGVNNNSNNDNAKQKQLLNVYNIKNINSVNIANINSVDNDAIISQINNANSLDCDENEQKLTEKSDKEEEEKTHEHGAMNKSNSCINIKESGGKGNSKYISPFPVPGYSLDENLWDFIVDLSDGDENQNKGLSEADKKNVVYTGIKHLLNKKKEK